MPRRRSAIWPDPRVKPPYGAAEIDWGHPLAQGLVGCWLFTEGAGVPATLGTPIPGTLENSPVWVPSPSGPALRFASNASVNLGNPTALQITDLLSVEVLFTATAVGILVAKDKDTGGRAFTFDVNGTPMNLRWYINGGGSGDLLSTSAPTVPWYQGVGTYSATTIALYLDGVQKLSQASGNASIPTATANVRFGRRDYAGFEDYLSGDIARVRIWRRQLAASDVSWLFAEPYAMLRPIIRRRYFVSAGGPAAYTLTADAASFTLTGIAAIPKAQRLISTVAATFTETGVAAGLAAQRKLTATTAAFTETGIATGLIATRRMAAAVGAFTLAGQAATFLSGRGFAATVGTYVLTGSAAGLAYGNRRLITVAGAFVLTGQAATLATSQTVAPVETVVLLGDGSGYPAAGHLTIGSEDIAYTGFTVAGGVTTFTGITRGARGTTVQTHVAGVLAHNGEQLRRGQRLTLFAGYAPLDEEDYGPGPGYVRMQIQAVNSPDNGMTWLVSATDIQRFIKRSVFTNASSDNPAVIGPDHPITIALKVLHSTGSGVNGPYDVLPRDQGAGVPQAFVATDLLEFIRDAVLPGLTMQFREITPTDAKGFIEGQCFRPLNLVPFITQRGRYSARLVRQPIFMRSGTVAFDAFRAAA